MPYSSVNDLPADLRRILPEHAQHIFKEAFNNAYDEYEDPDKRRTEETREETAFKVAWSAVKKEYEKADDGTWHAKDA